MHHEAVLCQSRAITLSERLVGAEGNIMVVVADLAALSSFRLRTAFLSYAVYEALLA